MGYEPRQMIGQEFYAFMVPQCRAFRRARHEHVIATGLPAVYSDQGKQGHHYSVLYMPDIHDGEVKRIMIFTTEIRAFVELLPSDTERIIM